MHECNRKMWMMKVEIFWTGLQLTIIFSMYLFVFAWLNDWNVVEQKVWTWVQYL